MAYNTELCRVLGRFLKSDEVAYIIEVGNGEAEAGIIKLIALHRARTRQMADGLRGKRPWVSGYRPWQWSKPRGAHPD